MFYKVISTAALITLIFFVYKFQRSNSNDKYVFLNDQGGTKAINKQTGELFIYIPLHGWVTYHEAKELPGELPKDKEKKLP